MSTPSSAPVIPDHFDLDFLINPENRPLFNRAFSGPQHEYLEEQYHVLCELQDTMLKLDDLLKFTVNNLRQRGISALIFSIKDLWLANLRLQNTLRKRVACQGRHHPYPPAPVTTPLQSPFTPQTSNRLSSHDSIMEDAAHTLTNLKCAPPNQNIQSAITAPQAPTHPLGTTSSLSTDEVPPLLVNKVFPVHMRQGICFQCQRTGHFKSFCPYYQCENCKRTSPQHYPKNCPFHHVNSPPYHSEDDDDEEDIDDVPDQLRDEEFEDNLGRNGAWGNVLGEPVDD
jgi:hypothetical protein